MPNRVIKNRKQDANETQLKTIKMMTQVGRCKRETETTAGNRYMHELHILRLIHEEQKANGFVPL